MPRGRFDCKVLLRSVGGAEEGRFRFQIAPLNTVSIETFSYGPSHSDNSVTEMNNYLINPNIMRLEHFSILQTLVCVLHCDTCRANYYNPTVFGRVLFP